MVKVTFSGNRKIIFLLGIPDILMECLDYLFLSIHV